MPVDTSVIIPVRNGERFVAEAIGSVLPQLDPDDEILVVDDHSTDGTRAVLATFTDPRLRPIEGNGKGVSAARNIGIAASRGELIVFLDHDDLWMPGRHAALRAVLRADAALGAAFGRWRLLYEPGAERYAMDALDGSFVFQIGVGTFRRWAVERVGGFDEGMRVGEDVDLLVRLDEAAVPVRICDLETMLYRRHRGNVSNDRATFRQAALAVLRRRIRRRPAGSAPADDPFARASAQNLELVRQTRERVKSARAETGNP
ncbi:MAG TPA: glycosyltransferase family A protein [Bauldia sp.]|nr:glycosyltransferase family A protein [Bauldia sp.]